MPRSTSKTKGPKFVQHFWPVIQALKELDGSGRAAEVVELVAKIEGVTEEEQQQRLKSGGLRFDNQVHFARQYLLWAGLLVSSERGVWSLTDAGNALTALSHEKALELFKQPHAAHKSKRAEVVRDEPVEDENERAIAVDDYKAAVLKRLRTTLTPRGFEHFCKRLLREYGFERVIVTGGPKDRGVDGVGILKINPFMSFCCRISVQEIRRSRYFKPCIDIPRKYPFEHR